MKQEFPTSDPAFLIQSVSQAGRKFKEDLLHNAGLKFAKQRNHLLMLLVNQPVWFFLDLSQMVSATSQQRRRIVTSYLEKRRSTENSDCHRHGVWTNLMFRDSQNFGMFLESNWSDVQLRKLALVGEPAAKLMNTSLCIL